MASQIYLVDASGTTIYLTGGSGSRYSGTGAPWTAQATSPFRLSMNDLTGPTYTPQAPQPLEIWNGGPPFRVGADLSFRGYNNVTEQFGIQLYGSTHNNAVALLRLLRRALSTAPTSNPAILVVQPDGATNAVYYEVHGGIVQESPSFLNEEAHASEIRAVVTWTRSPLGGSLGGGETLINGAAVANTGTGTPDNLESLGTSGTGELIYEGGPLNVRFTPTSTSTTSYEVLIATCAGRTYSNRSDAISAPAAGALIASVTYNASAFVTNRNLRLRVIARVTSATSNMQLSAWVSAGDNAQGTIYESPWVQASTSTSDVLVDLGGADPSILYRTRATSTVNLNISIFARSTTGSNATGTLDYVELIPYYTWASFYHAEPTASSFTLIEQFVERSGLPALPIPQRASLITSSNTYGNNSRIIGRAPVYISGAQIYVAWRTISANVHSTSATATLSVTHAPLFHTLRGAG